MGSADNISSFSETDADVIFSFSDTKTGDDGTVAASSTTAIQAASKCFIPLGQLTSSHTPMCDALVREVHVPWGIKLRGKKYERCRETRLRRCVNNCGRQVCSTHMIWGSLCSDCSSWWCPSCTRLKPLHTCSADASEFIIHYI